MTTVTTLLLTSVLSGAALDFIEGSEIGTADQFVAFESHGRYHAEKVDKKAGNTTLKGTWSISEPQGKDPSTNLEQKTGKVTVKVASCKGPNCKALQKDYTADIEQTAERAMVVRASAADAMFASGSYYCHYQGCEKRIGVEMLSKDAKARTMNYLLDFMIDQNRKRDVTVVWWGKKQKTDVGKTRIEWCSRESERAKKGAELVQADLATLPWLGSLEVSESAEKDCLWDVRLYVADDVMPPAKQR